MIEYNLSLREKVVPVFGNAECGPVDLWVSSVADILAVSPINPADAAPEHRLAGWLAGDLRFARSEYHDMVAKHTNWHVEERGQEIHVHRYPKGRASVDTKTGHVDCEVCSMTLLDYGRPFTSIHTASVCESIFVPHAAIDFDPAVDPTAWVYDPYSLMGRLLNAEFDYLFDQLDRGVAHLREADIARLIGCVEYAISRDKASRSARMQAKESLKELIQDYIEANLSHRNLSVASILANFGLSRASLYRMFDEEDGVRSYISRRRLQRAVMQIAENPMRRGQIHEAAANWGFSSDTQFNRSVRRAFGVAPGSLFEMPLPDRDFLEQQRSKWQYKYLNSPELANSLR